MHWSVSNTGVGPECPPAILMACIQVFSILSQGPNLVIRTKISEWDMTSSGSFIIQWGRTCGNILIPIHYPAKHIHNTLMKHMFLNHLLKTKHLGEGYAEIKSTAKEGAYLKKMWYMIPHHNNNDQLPQNGTSIGIMRQNRIRPKVIYYSTYLTMRRCWEYKCTALRQALIYNIIVKQTQD